MLVPISWLNEYVKVTDMPAEELAEKLTVAGLEVGGIKYIGVPQQQVEGIQVPPSDHLVWDRDKILWARVREVKPHPDADKLVLAMVDYGGAELEQCVTGAPNLFEYRGQGELSEPLYTAWAAEGAEVWNGHIEGWERMILKEKKLRGIPNRSMVCSEKELGISEEHEGIIIMSDSFGHEPGTPLQDVLGDVVLDIEYTPNLARALSMFGVAREVAALLDRESCAPSYKVVAEGAPIAGQVSIEIREPELNPRFTLALLSDMAIQPSPEWMQWRLKLIGQRPINNIVDVTNYVMFEIGQPLHAFDYDKLRERAGGNAPTIITRLPEPDEKLTTLDDVERALLDYNIMVADTKGVHSLGGIMGGAETEIGDDTTTVLLEAANWNFINIRRSVQAHKLFSEASARFSRGVHPSQALLGLKRGIELMRQTAGGTIAEGFVDEYPLPAEVVKVDLPISEVRRLMGIDFEIEDAAAILRRLQFDVAVDGEVLHVTVPDHRLDISSDAAVGQADLIEEIARVNGYDKIPETIIADEMPPQRPNPDLDREEAARDVLVALGLREHISYRFTTPEREGQLVPPDAESSLPDAGYIEMANPISSDKTHLRHTLLVNLLEAARNNSRYTDRQQVFEIGSVYLKRAGEVLPDEPRRLGILMTGPRDIATWTNGGEAGTVDFYDIKGLVEALLDGLHIDGATYSRADHSTLHPGRSALLSVQGREIGVFGELHPLVAQAFDLGDAPIMAAEFDLDALLSFMSELFRVQALPTTPPVLQDMAIVVRENITNAEIEAVIYNAGGDLLRDARLFDVYRGDPIEAGHKSLAYNLTYQAADRTLTDKEVAKAHAKIVKAVEKQLDAKLRA